MIKALTEARKVNLRLGSPIHAPTRRNEKEGKCKAKTENFQKIIPSDSGQTSQKEGHRKTRRSSMKPCEQDEADSKMSVFDESGLDEGGDFGIRSWRRLRYPRRRLRYPEAEISVSRSGDVGIHCGDVGIHCGDVGIRGGDFGIHCGVVGIRGGDFGIHFLVENILS